MLGHSIAIPALAASLVRKTMHGNSSLSVDYVSCIILSLSGVLVPGVAEFRAAGMFAVLVLRSRFGLQRRMRQRKPDRQQMLDQRERSGQRRISVIRTYADIAYLQACRTEGGF
jgi:hypothetical protein